MSTIHELCKCHTDLSDNDIVIIEQTAETLQFLANIEDADTFIDCPTFKGAAVVVAEAKPSHVPSSYQNTVVGLLARQENEPAVIRSFRLGTATRQMKAVTQERTQVIQSVEPIYNNDRVIGVLIVEKRVDERHSACERCYFSQQSCKRIVKKLPGDLMEKNWLTECIDEALIIVDQSGVVVFCNSLAESLYAQLGFVEGVLGQYYENIRLIGTEHKKGEGYSDIEIMVGKHFLSIKYIRLDAPDMSFAVFIRDITDIREREKELILKSVAIKEMHHRIKNNLQTIASLLRLQVRRSNNEETSRVLNESMNRILSIASTHEVLAQSGVDYVKIGEVILNIKNYSLRNFVRPNFDISVQLEGDDFEVESDIATSVALIINELLQNSLEYAFVDRQKGTVRIIVEKGGLYSQIQIIDDGYGFNIDKIGKNRLGLSIVQSLVKDKLRGDLNIESDSGGTKATFSFINNLMNHSDVM